jgi:hypothetical protein
MRKFFIGLSCAFLAACSADAPLEPAPHFFVAPKDSHWFEGALLAETFDEDSCRARIASVVCLVDPVIPGEETERPCLTDTDLGPAISSLQTIYDAYPQALKNVFCSLGRIYLEKKSVGTAYAGTTPDGSMAIMGFRADLLLGEAPSLSRWVSWKEQLSFGGSRDYSVRDDLVKIESSSSLAAPASDFIYYVIAHEFGHILDFKLKVNDWSCNESGDTCTPKPASWPELSWSFSYPQKGQTPEDPWGLSAWEPNASAAFDHRSELCFYGCADGRGKPELMEPLYASLHQGSFLTTYSATNSWDDFAETVAFYAGTRYTNLSYTAVLPSGTRFDLVEKYLHSESFRAKREWVERFFEKLENPPQP